MASTTTSPKKTTKTTKTSKPKPKLKKKVKPADIFLGSKEVAKEQAKLKELQKSRKVIENNIKEMIDTYNSKSVIKEGGAERFLEKLPLDSLKEFYEFTAGQKRESSLSILKIRSKLRRQKEIKEYELDKIESEIALSQIDLLLAKINHMIKLE